RLKRGPHPPHVSVLNETASRWERLPSRSSPPRSQQLAPSGRARLLLEPRRSAVLISGLTTGPPQGWVAGSDRFWLCELRVSQQISTFYGSSVQSMGTQLNALPALLVRARTVSGCLNSVFLGLERNRPA